MISVIDLELRISERGGQYFADMELSLPHSSSVPARDVLLPIVHETLLMFQPQPEVYGRVLTTMVFRPKLLEGWAQAYTTAEARAGLLRLRLTLHGGDALHAIHWELLCNPLDQEPLGRHERILLSRFIPSAHPIDHQLPLRPALQALLVVAAPADLAQYQLPPIPATELVQTVHQALPDLPIMVLDQHRGPKAAGLRQLKAALRTNPQIVCVICHGTLVKGQPYLWLEAANPEKYAPTSGRRFVEALTNLQQQPLLVILISCHSGGEDEQVLTALGPQLAQAGIGAVLAFHGAPPQAMIADFLPRLLRELLRDGQIDRAIAAARADVPPDKPWWQARLWMALSQGRLWHTQPPGIAVRSLFHVPSFENPQFQGRERELAELAATLLSTNHQTTIPIITGMGGVGKTQLALEFIRRYRDQYPGGIFWLNMAETTMIERQIAAIGGPNGLNIAGWDTFNLPSQLDVVRRSWEEPVERLLIFDNVIQPDVIERWRPHNRYARLLVTTRRGLWPETEGYRILHLKPLPRTASIRLLLSQRARYFGQDTKVLLRNQAIHAEAQTICELLGDLPLALSLAGTYLQRQPDLDLAIYRQRLQELCLQHPSLNLNHSGERLPPLQAQGVAASIALSYSQLDLSQRVDRNAFRILEQFAFLAPELVPQALVIQLIPGNQEPEQLALRALRRLATFGLIDLQSNGESRLHRLIAQYVRDRVKDEVPIRIQNAAALTAVLAQINRAERLLEGQAYLAHAHVVAQRAPADPVYARLLHELGYFLAAADQIDPARREYERSLRIYRQLGQETDPVFAVGLNNLGHVLTELGDLRNAQRSLIRAVEIWERSGPGENPDIAHGLNNLGRVLLAQDKLEAAQQCYERALQIQERHGEHDDPVAAQTLNNLGEIFRKRRDLNRARDYYTRALTIRVNTLGYAHPHTAISLNNLASVLIAQSDIALARTYYQQALEIMQQQLGLQHPHTQRVRVNLERFQHQG
ncbi:MAG: tetratricopeptide repeat protein [Oscillochloris sp.]|nr:tetratricopeptide repeat protein [Oscillochloris sp.]